jgi:demethylmenaquinone methyltransferase/2-methoxy-6-polyprenyl-1,4-benzoquinol methylase
MPTEPADENLDAEHRAAIERSRRRWEFLSSRWGFVERDTVGVRREAVDLLDLSPGDRVLDLGCGPGVNFEALREAVGPEGLVVGVDLARGMVERARERVETRGWENVEVVQADATRLSYRRPFDGALATTAVSAMPDVRGVVERVHDALVPGARFALYEIRLVPSGPARVLNPLVERFYRAFGNWNTEEDVLTELRRTFDSVEEGRSFALGTNYLAVARTADEGPSGRPHG